MINKTIYNINNPLATIIIVHGIAEHSGRYERLAKEFNKEGYDVITYDHLGHGKSDGKRGKIKSFFDHVNVLHDIVLEEKKRTNNKIFLMGHSMGGGIVNIYAVTYQDVDGIISSSAATKTPKNAVFMKVTGFWFLRWLGLSTKMFDKHLAKDPNVLEKNKNDELMLKKIYVSLIGEMFIKGVKYLHKNIDAFQTPVLYLHGTDDKIVDASASKEMYRKLRNVDKEIKIYEGEFHEMLNDYNRETVLEDVKRWLKKRV
ncbi:MAG: alpha/beta hydrolase [Acholeplasma sp.]|nr:alpha/beta hydrolase [Acholeplasma sp.]